MKPIFLFGTLCHQPLLSLVAGEAVGTTAAVMSDAEVVWVDGASWPMLVDKPGARAEGLLIEPSADALARLDFYEACFDYHRVPVTIETQTGSREAEAWRPAANTGTPGAPWSLEDWAEAWGPLSEAAAAEVMRQMRHYSPEEIGHRFWIIRARAQAQLETAAWRRPNFVGHGLEASDAEVVARRVPYSRFFELEELRIRARQFDGELSPPQERAVFRVANAVTVLPYDPVRDRILLIEQIRLGAFSLGDQSPWLLEPVAGIIDPGETAETTARREAVEEAGLTLDTLHLVARYYPSPGGVAQIISSYIGIADLPDGITGVNGAEGEGEDILSHLVPFDLACRMLEEGDMANAPLIMSFQWLQMNRERLRAAA